MTQVADGVALPFAKVDKELDMAIAVSNFGSLAAANDALTIVVDTARAEMGEADVSRASADWMHLACWVHRTRGALVLFGAPGLRQLGEHFEEQSWAHTGADAAFAAYRVALITWLVDAEAHLAVSRARL